VFGTGDAVVWSAMTIVLALLSAALYGAGVALQQRPASAVPARYAARPSLLVRVARQPAWLAGVAAEIGGFTLQVIALRHGSLVVVQPLLTTSLLFTIALIGAWTRQGVTASEWLALVGVVAGLAVFMAVASPGERSSGQAGPADWILTILSIGAGVIVLVGYGLRATNRSKAAALGLAAGLGDALMAVLIKAFSRVTDHGFAATVSSWTPYALCAIGLVAMLLTQTAYQVGLPKVTLPIITVADPLVSCGIGVALFGEALHFAGGRAPIVLASIGVMAAGLIVLSRSPAASLAREPAVTR
jgi:drug/metabolite transporter (DMT)-like permease